MIVIKCSRCKKKIFKYLKFGKGRLWHCWKDRIIEDFSKRDGNNIKCHCGNIIGIDEDNWIKLKQRSFLISGTKTW